METLTTNYKLIASGPQQSFNGVIGYLQLYAKYNSQNIENNTTNYSVQLRLVVSGGYIGNYQSTPYSVSGTSISNSGDLGSQNYVSMTLVTATGDVTHSTDGTKNVDMNGSINFTAWGQTLTVSGSATLPTIPRASSITAIDCDIESSTIININRASNSFTHTVTYSFGSLSGTIATKTSNTSIGWAVPNTFYGQIPNAKYGNVTLTCQTYSGNTLIGTKTNTFKVTANEDLSKPQVTITAIDVNSATTALTGDNKKIVKGYSNVQCTYTITPRNSATISSRNINGASLANNSGSITINNANASEFRITATDTRGYSNTTTASGLTIINYIPLKADTTFKRNQPTDGNVKLSFTGDYYNGSFGSQSNSLAITWQYKESSSNTWLNGGTISSNQYTISNNKITGTNISLTNPNPDSGYNNFNYKKAYDFRLVLVDKLVQYYADGSITKGIPVYWWNKDKFTVEGNLKAHSFQGYVWDWDTANTTSTWVPVLSSDGKWQHRAISTSLVPVTGGGSTIVTNNLTANRVLISNSNGKVAVDSTTTTQLGYMKNKTIYSTTESKIGTWVDGKPIYRKVITGSTENKTSTVIGNISNVDNMIHIYGFCNVADGEHKSIPCVEGSNYISASMLPNGNVRVDNTTSIYFRGSAVVIVEYTKTTD